MYNMQQIQLQKHVKSPTLNIHLRTFFFSDLLVNRTVKRIDMLIYVVKNIQSIYQTVQIVYIKLIYVTENDIP